MDTRKAIEATAARHTASELSDCDDNNRRMASLLHVPGQPNAHGYMPPYRSIGSQTIIFNVEKGTASVYGEQCMRTGTEVNGGSTHGAGPPLLHVLAYSKGNVIQTPVA
jgi:hypothetical protein